MEFFYLELANSLSLFYLIDNIKETLRVILTANKHFHILGINCYSTFAGWRELLPFTSLSSRGRETSDQRGLCGRYEFHNVC